MDPYRESPRLLLCPRCGEVLEQLEQSVAVCPRCQGLWIAQTTLDASFGPRWPEGANMWWHNELECPECAAEGTVTKMAARSAKHVMVDACPSHGLWLDQGELARLFGLGEGADELLELQQHLGYWEPAVLEQRRRAWSEQLETRKRASAEFRARAEADYKRQVEAAAEAQRAELELQAERTAAKLEAERQAARAELLAERDRVVASLQALEAQLAAKRDEVYRLQGDVETAKQRIRALTERLATS